MNPLDGQNVLDLLVVAKPGVDVREYRRVGTAHYFAHAP